MYLVEGVEQLGNQRTSRAGMSENTLETEFVEITDEAVGGGAESERISPKVPLERDDRGGEHASPDEGQSRLSARKTGV